MDATVGYKDNTIYWTIQSCDDDKKLSSIREEVREFLKDFPLYKDWLSEMKELDKK